MAVNNTLIKKIKWNVHKTLNHDESDLIDVYKMIELWYAKSGRILADDVFFYFQLGGLTAEART